MNNRDKSGIDLGKCAASVREITDRLDFPA